MSDRQRVLNGNQAESKRRYLANVLTNALRRGERNWQPVIDHSKDRRQPNYLESPNFRAIGAGGRGVNKHGPEFVLMIRSRTELLPAKPYPFTLFPQVIGLTETALDTALDELGIHGYYCGGCYGVWGKDQCCAYKSLLSKPHAPFVIFASRMGRNHRYVTRAEAKVALALVDFAKLEPVNVQAFEAAVGAS